MPFITENATLLGLRSLLLEDTGSLVYLEVRESERPAPSATALHPDAYYGADYVGFTGSKASFEEGGFTLLYPAMLTSTGHVTLVPQTFNAVVNADVIASVQYAAPETLWAKRYLTAFLNHVQRRVDAGVFDDNLFSDIKRGLEPKEFTL